MYDHNRDAQDDLYMVFGIIHKGISNCAKAAIQLATNAVICNSIHIVALAHYHRRLLDIWLYSDKYK